MNSHELHQHRLNLQKLRRERKAGATGRGFDWQGAALQRKTAAKQAQLLRSLHHARHAEAISAERAKSLGQERRRRRRGRHRRKTATGAAGATSSGHYSSKSTLQEHTYNNQYTSPPGAQRWVRTLSKNSLGCASTSALLCRAGMPMHGLAGLRKGPPLDDAAVPVIHDDGQERMNGIRHGLNQTAHSRSTLSFDSDRRTPAAAPGAAPQSAAAGATTRSGQELTLPAKRFLAGARLDSSLSTLCSYSARRVVAFHANPALRDVGISPHLRQIPAVLASVCISGWEQMTRKLLNQGPAGVAQLSKNLNRAFSLIVQEVTNRGGDIIKFSGSSVLIMFAQLDPHQNAMPLHSSPAAGNAATVANLGKAPSGMTRTESQLGLSVAALQGGSGAGPLNKDQSSNPCVTPPVPLEDFAMRGLQCLVALQAIFNQTDAVPGVPLALSCGLAAGSCCDVFVGGHRDRWEHMLVGSQLHNLVSAMSAAAPGDIVLDPVCHRLIAPRVSVNSFEQNGESYATVVEVLHPLADSQCDSNSISSSRLPSLAIHHVERNSTGGTIPMRGYRRGRQQRPKAAAASNNVTRTPYLASPIARSIASARRRLEIQKHQKRVAQHQLERRPWLAALGMESQLAIASQQDVIVKQPVSGNKSNVGTDSRMSLNDHVKSAPPMQQLREALGAYVPHAFLSQLTSVQSGPLRVGQVSNISLVHVVLPTPVIHANANIETVRDCLMKLQRMMSRIQKVVSLFFGTISSVQIGPSGSPVLAIAFGLFSNGSDGNVVPLRASRAALGISRSLKDINISTHLSIASGQVFCGTVGKAHRFGFVFCGPAVHRGAALLGEALSFQRDQLDDLVVCDPQTIKMCGSVLHNIHFEHLRDDVHNLSYVSEDVPSLATQVLLARGVSVSESAANAQAFEGVRSLLSIAQSSDNVEHPLCLEFRAANGHGKSSLLAYTIQKARHMGFAVLAGYGEETYRWQPYHMWSSIILDILLLRRSDQNGAQPFNAVGKSFIFHLQKIVNGLIAHLPVRLRSYVCLLQNVCPYLQLPMSAEAERLSAQDRSVLTQDIVVELVRLWLRQKLSVVQATEQKEETSRPILIAYDDIQWCDESSMQLVRLIQKTFPRCVFISTRCTTKNQDELNEESKINDAVTNSVSAAGQSSVCYSSGLTKGQVRQLIVLSLGLPARTRVYDDVVTYLLERSEGCPQVVFDLTHSLHRDHNMLSIDRGKVTFAKGMSLAQVVASDLPHHLHDLLGAGFDSLPASSMLLLELCSLFTSVNQRMLVDIFPVRTPESLAVIPDQLDKLAQSGFLLKIESAMAALPDAPRYVFRSHLIRQIVLKRVAPVQLAAWHASVANYFEQRHEHALRPYLPCLIHHWISSAAAHQKSNRNNHLAAMSSAIAYLRQSATQAVEIGADQEAACLLGATLLHHTNLPFRDEAEHMLTELVLLQLYCPLASASMIQDPKKLRNDWARLVNLSQSLQPGSPTSILALIGQAEMTLRCPHFPGKSSELNALSKQLSLVSSRGGSALDVHCARMVTLLDVFAGRYNKVIHRVNCSLSIMSPCSNSSTWAGFDHLLMEVATTLIALYPIVLALEHRLADFGPKLVEQLRRFRSETSLDSSQQALVAAAERLFSSLMQVPVSQSQFSQCMTTFVEYPAVKERLHLCRFVESVSSRALDETTGNVISSVSSKQVMVPTL